MRAQIYSERFRRGLQTTQQPDGADRLDGFRRFHGVTTQTGDAERVKGKVRLARVDVAQQSQVFDGVDQRVVAWMGEDVWDFNREEWTLELLVKTDSAGVGGEGLLVVGHTTPVLQVGRSEATLDVELWYADSSKLQIGPLALTEDVKHGIQVERLGASIVTRVDGVVLDTSAIAQPFRSPVGDLHVGEGFGAANYEGVIDYIRLFDYAKGHHRDRWMRLLNPRGKRVLFDMIFPGDGNGIVWDRSTHERHGKQEGTAAWTTEASLAWQDAPIQCLAPYTDADQERRCLVVAAGREYDARL